MKGLKYVLRLLRGESPESIIKSMPDEDYNTIKGFTKLVDNRVLNRSARRKIERKFDKLKR